MVDQRLVDYLKSYVSQGYSREQLAQHLSAQGWSKAELDSAFDQVFPKKQGEPFFKQAKPEAQAKAENEAKPSYDFGAKKGAFKQAGIEKPEKSIRRPSEASHFVPVAVLACVFVVIGAFFYSYFYVINPTFVSRPILAKPEMPTVGSAISTAQVEYVLNEMDLYKLHGNPVG